MSNELLDFAAGLDASSWREAESQEAMMQEAVRSGEIPLEIAEQMIAMMGILRRARQLDPELLEQVIARLQMILEARS